MLCYCQVEFILRSLNYDAACFGNKTYTGACKHSEQRIIAGKLKKDVRVKPSATKVSSLQPGR